MRDLGRRALAESACLVAAAAALRPGEHLHLDLREVGAVADRHAGEGLFDPREPLSGRRLRGRPKVRRRTWTLSPGASGRTRGTTCSSNIFVISRGTPGMKKRSASAQLHLEAGRGADRVREDLGAAGEIGLLRVRRAHRAPELLEAPADVIERGLVALGRDAQRLGDGLAREVVRGRAEAAGADDDASEAREAFDGGDDPAAIVIDGRLLDDLEAEVGEAGGEPGPVRVATSSPRARELGSDAEDSARHGEIESSAKGTACRSLGRRAGLHGSGAFAIRGARATRPAGLAFAPS